MRKVFVSVAFCLISFFCFSQESYLQSIKSCPKTPSKEAVDAYYLSLDSLLDELDKKDEKFKAENEAVVNNIDKASLAQSYQNYGQGMTVEKVQELQRLNQAVIDDQRIMADLTQLFRTKKDSIDAIYNADMKIFNEDFLEFITNCTGEGGGSSKCKSMFSNLDQSRIKILDKYFFGTSALYVKYLDEFKAAIPAPTVQNGLDALNLSELRLNGMAVFPHKEDMAYVEVAQGIIKEIQNVFVIEDKLWPSQ